MKSIQVYSKSFGMSGFVEMVGGDDRILVKFADNVSHWIPQSDLFVMLDPEDLNEYITKYMDKT